MRSGESGLVVSGEITICDERMRRLVLPNARLTRLSSGHLWAEGPVYVPPGDYLLWSDIPQNRTYQWVGELGTRVLAYASNYANGNTLDREGRRVTCEHLSRSVVRFEHDGTRVVIADQYDGKRLNSPNDVVVASDGAVWFTDPTYGILSDYEGERSEPEQPGCFVYRVDPITGAVEAKIRSLAKPNGLAFSPDESILYVADSAFSHDPQGRRDVVAFPVLAGYEVGDGKTLVSIGHGVPDGLRVDEFGNLWISSGRGVEIHAADGALLGVIHVPEAVANLCFGGPKNNRLFITASTSVYAMHTAVRGAARPAQP